MLQIDGKFVDDYSIDFEIEKSYASKASRAGSMIFLLVMVLAIVRRVSKL